MTLFTDAYHAARARAGLFDRSSRGRLRVSGDDRTSFLHAILTNDVATLADGRGCHALYLTPQGRLIADLDVLDVGEALWLGVDGDLTAPLMQKLDQLIFAEQVTIEDVGSSMAQWHLCGPDAAAILASIAGLDDEPLARERLSALGELDHLRVRIGGHDGRIVRVDATGLAGFDVYVEAGRTAALHGLLVDAGAVDLPAEVVDALRVEAGIPRFHVDIDETTIPLEAGLERQAISFDKGCYVGQEVIVRVMHRGHGRVARKLVGLTLSGTVVPPPGRQLVSGDREIGRVTSSILSPALNRPIALGYVHRDFQEPGTAVEIDAEGARVPAVVTRLPFVSA
ncbi:MAG TPA: aminomethyltransferase family protein [Vicinamibacterales bacterium]|nr:aminomethyltransferase family protein [Vicinamibacterales bacterium]